MRIVHSMPIATGKFRDIVCPGICSNDVLLLGLAGVDMRLDAGAIR